MIVLEETTLNHEAEESANTLGGNGTDPNVSKGVEAAKMPVEIWMHILKYVDHVCLCRLAQASKHFHVLANDKTAWKALCDALGIKPKASLIEVLNEIQTLDEDVHVVLAQGAQAQQSESVTATAVNGDVQEREQQEVAVAPSEPTKTSAQKKEIDWKALYMDHYETEKLYQFRRRSFWADYAAMKGLIDQTKRDARRDLLNVRNAVNRIPCIQCEKDKKSKERLMPFGLSGPTQSDLDLPFHLSSVTASEPQLFHGPTQVPFLSRSTPSFGVPVQRSPSLNLSVLRNRVVDPFDSAYGSPSASTVTMIEERQQTDAWLSPLSQITRSALLSHSLTGECVFGSGLADLATNLFGDRYMRLNTHDGPDERFLNYVTEVVN
ncbi:hypothetical protein HDU97_005354 [Phlyctochytrium planicorne]|nr:hypothetical protein HDU97_005354 [Phlyctochytrium planicorne]